MSGDYKKIVEREKDFWNKRHEEKIADDDSLIQDVDNFISRAISPFEGGKDIRLYDQIQFLKKHFEGIEGKTVLEPACGSGTVGCYLAKYKNCYVEGFDITQKGIEIAERRKKLLQLEGKINFTVQSFYETSFPDNHFDVIVGNSLHHMHDFNKIGNEMSRVLKKGGKAVFIEPYGHNRIFNYVREHYLFGAGGGSPDERGNYMTDDKIKTLASYFSKVDCEQYRFFMMAGRSVTNLSLLRVFDTLDSMIRKIPPAKKYFGFIGLVLYK